MPIYQAFQFAQAPSQGGTRVSDPRHRGNQILGWAHLLPILRSEQADLRLSLLTQNAPEFSRGLSARVLPRCVRILQGQIARLVARLFG